MPGAHTHLQYTLQNLHEAMAQDQWTLQEKGKSQKGTGARAVTAGPCCSCQRDSSCSLQTVASCDDDPGAHGMDRGHSKMNRTGQSKLERGQTVEKGSGYGIGDTAGTQPAEQATAGGHSRRPLRPAQASKQTATSWPASQHKHNSCQTMLSCLLPCSAGRWGECKDVGTQEGGCRPTYRSLPHLTPLPVTVPTHSLNFDKPNLAPNLTFFYFYSFIFTPYFTHYNFVP